MIIVAVDNEEVLNDIKERYGSNVYKYDITYMEGVIELLSKQKNNLNEQIILITKDTLSGNLKKELYIKQIRLVSKNVRIVLLTESLNMNYKEFLFANEVFNIIEGKEIDIEKVVYNIENNEKVVYKETDLDNKIILNENVIKYKTSIVPKQFIAVYGTSGSGKSYISSVIIKKISKTLNISSCLIDMDFENPAIDILNNLDFSNSSLLNIIQDIDFKRDINESLKNNTLVKENISYITNNIGIYDYQNKLNESYYLQIYNNLNNKYDYIFANLPAFPFIDVVPFTLKYATKILFVVNPNYISIRQAIKYLELINKLWEIDKSNIYIIINKYDKNSLDVKQVESFFIGYQIIGIVNQNKNLEGYINGISNNIDNDVDINKIINSFGVQNVDNKVKYSIKSKISSAFKGRKPAYDN